MQQEDVTLSPEIRAFLAANLEEFKTVGWYEKSLDWFFYLTRDCPTTEFSTGDSGIQKLVDNATGETVGFQIIDFAGGARTWRARILDAAGIDIRDIRDDWIEDLRLQAKEFSRQHLLFFDELCSSGPD